MLDITAATGIVMIHASTIGFIKDQFAALFTSPIPKTAPIKICVELTGIPKTVASITILAADNSAEKPLAGCIFVKFVPTVWMTSLPMNQSPATSAIPNVIITIGGIAASPFTAPVANVSIIAANGPTAFEISLLPCEKANPHAVKT